MQTNSGKQLYLAFLAKEYATENLEFYVAAEELLLLQSNNGTQFSTIRLAFTALLEQYVGESATTQINISAALAEKLLAAEATDAQAIGGGFLTNELIIELLTEALREISLMLEFGSFPRFQNSALYNEHMADFHRFPYYFPDSLKF
jgi:hypothetical protein